MSRITLAIAVLLGASAIGLLPGSARPDQACQEELRLRSATLVYAAPPSFSTRQGWTLAPRQDSLGEGTVVRVCERRAIGFLVGRRTWLQVSYGDAAQQRRGWVYVTPPGGGDGQSAGGGIAGVVAALVLPRPALAQDVGLPSAGVPTESLLWPFLLYGCVILGMVAKALHDYFMDGFPAERRKYLGQTFAALVASPIVLGGINNLGGLEISGLSGVQGFMAYLLLAFENGFFWQALIARRGSAAAKAG